jgi:hypothetical protein
MLELIPTQLKRMSPIKGPTLGKTTLRKELVVFPLRNSREEVGIGIYC